MHGIGKLKSVQALDGFYGKNEIGYRIGELEHMNDFRRIKLCAEKWNFNFAKNILDDLQPLKCLKNMSIKRYMYARSTIWASNVNPNLNLKKIKFDKLLRV
ncbi:hypothetical protein IEQ34_001691 [Dendrobium chrysotoxum]|uniref:Uncharacterized protein n=1 Tax=Dendrobium chrysotoxum TaxID=161865 RepID=A0AAV7GJU5_DENCH|nr:hypothetical protein IEQ34_015445 [Dendrobium chrysotoxum]KAH0455903.1 hypothetical protein IEQ34_015935 [Dendrobium chrysotoxum]KAH0463515.1 hypothetical protein IEQ34_008097 [Dendrobium chrysotoxum]KAH0470133.1 hypothetical protein IEQ34_001691 [Dendrobium chrysotoxum]